MFNTFSSITISISKVLEQVGLNVDTNCSSTTIMSLSGSSVTAFRLQNDLVSFMTKTLK